MTGINASYLNQKSQSILKELDEILQDVSDATTRRYNEVKCRMSRTELLEKKAEQTFDEILLFNSQQTKPEDKVIYEQVFQDIKEKVQLIKTKFFKIEEDYALKQSAVGFKLQASANNLKRPKINLKTFDGSNVGEFNEFITIYNVTIHNCSTLSEVEKHTYLRSYLTGAALKLIENIMIDTKGANYKQAYDLLVQTYGDSRKCLTFYMNEILQFKDRQKEKKFSYKDFLIAHQNSCTALKNVDLTAHKVDLNNFVLFYLSYSNLDKKEQKEFDIELKGEFPTLEKLHKFCEVRAKAEDFKIESKHESSKSESSNRNGNHNWNKHKSNSSNDSRTYEKSPRSLLVKKNACVLCKADHPLYKCDEFKRLDVSKRWGVIRNNELCALCFNHHHIDSCKFKPCVCGKKHNSRLCLELAKKNNQNQSSQESKQDSKASDDEGGQKQAFSENPNVKGSSLACMKPSSTIVLATLSCYAEDIHGNTHKLRGLLDQGSMLNLLTTEAAEKLELKYKRAISGHLVGISGEVTPIYGQVKLVIKSTTEDYHIQVNFDIVDKISSPLPFSELDSKIKDDYEGMPFADANFTTPGNIEFLLNVDLYCEIVKTGEFSFIKSTPSLQDTHFGFVVLGKAPGKSQEHHESRHSFFIQESPSTINEELVKRFWKNESFPNDEFSQAEICEKHFKENTIREPSGRFSVSFPFKSEEKVGRNREAAFQSYLNMEKRLQKKPETFDQYRKFMDEFIDLGHMNISARKENYILPQHCVIRPERSSTKLRTVFNASHQDDKGESLNNKLWTGPYIQKDLCAILSGFRFHKISLVADIKMAYRNISINEEHRRFQHIFYRPTPDSPVQEYEVNRLLYGLRPASFLLQRVLKELAIENLDEHPLASYALINETYMDDIISGASTVEETRELRDQLIELLKKGGFELKKFISSNDEVLNDLPQSKLESTLSFDENEQLFKVLGMKYNSREDAFLFSICSTFDAEMTIRNVLSFVARLFDPLNFLAPITLRSRYILQRAHELKPKLKWDDELPIDLKKLWLDLITEMKVIANLRIPRHIRAVDGESTLVMFSDASTKGYAAVAYVHNQQGNLITSSLLRAKIRVAPIKPLTIPKLELNAALLASDLAKQIVEQTSRLKFARVVMYCDSTIALCWIKADPGNLEAYEKHRVEKIQKISQASSWRYIPTSLNGADIASRGANPKRFEKKFEEWINGPEFLQTPYSEWPNYEFNQDLSQVPGFKKTPTVLVTTKKQENRPYQLICQKSSFFHITRIFAHLNRIIDFLRKKQPLSKEPLSASEIRQAALTACKVSQNYFFKDDIKAIRNNKPCSARLANLNPFLDSHGILRVGGRLENSNLPYNAKHPVIIDNRCHLARLIIEDYHEKYLHSGPTTVKASIRQKFWILRAHNLIRSIIKKCTRCVQFQAKTHQPIMAPLPPGRVNSSRPFAVTAMDFGGPFEMVMAKTRRPTILKGYFCVFTCLAVRAIHIEVVSELTSEAFLAALQRFVSRRGLPQKIYCDNGRNFCGAAKQIEEVSKFLKDNEDKILNATASLSIEFKFHPPYASNFAGIVESQVKAIKNLFKKHFGERRLTYEEFTTVFIRIESQINQRPLTVVTSESDDLDILTPGHFLAYGHLNTVPEVPFDENVTVKCRWKALKQISQAFWKRWINHYLNQLQQRNKWKTGISNPEIGQLCYVTSLDTAPGFYPLAKIVKLHPSNDGVVRVVTLQLRDNKQITRSTNKLIFIPSREHDFECACQSC